MAADETALGALHDAVAKALSTALQGQVLEGYTDEDGNVQEPTVIPPSAAIIQAATKFLKDNNITCAPSKDNSLGELEDIMRRRRASAAARKADYQDATSDMAFTTGLQ